MHVIYQNRTMAAFNNVPLTKDKQQLSKIDSKIKSIIRLLLSHLMNG